MIKTSIHLLILESTHMSRDQSSWFVSLAWSLQAAVCSFNMVLTPHGDLYREFPHLPNTGHCLPLLLPPSLHPYISGDLLSFSFIQTGCPEGWPWGKRSCYEVSHHSFTSSSLCHFPWSALSNLLTTSSILLSSFFSSYSSLPVPQSFSLYLYLYQHIKTNYNSRWATTASPQVPIKATANRKKREEERDGDGEG